MSRQPRFDARYWMLGAGALGRPRGMEWGGRREEGSGWGTHDLEPLFGMSSASWELAAHETIERISGLSRT